MTETHFLGQSTQKVIVTGGAGFIGSHLVDELLARGYYVDVIDNLAGGDARYVNSKATLYQVDICNLDAIKPLIVGAKYVFHLAALPRVQFSLEHPQEAHEANVTGFLNVLIASHEAGVKKVVFSSSSSVYGDQDTMPLVETMTPSPKSPYALHKYIGEEYAKLWSTAFSLGTVSLRYFNVYGTRQNPDGAYALVIGKFLKMKKERKSLTITGDGNQTRDFTHVDDVVCANILAAESEKVGKGEVINIGAGINQSVNRVAELIGGPVEYIPARFEPHDTLADNKLAKELLGWEPTVVFEEGMRLLINQ